MPTQIEACLATLEMIQEYQEKGVKNASSLRLAIVQGEFRNFPTYQKALEKLRAKPKGKGKEEKSAPDGAKKAPEGEWVRVLKKEKPVVKKDSKPAALGQVPPNEGAPGALRVVKKVTTYYEKKKP